MQPAPRHLGLAQPWSGSVGGEVIWPSDESGSCCCCDLYPRQQPASAVSSSPSSVTPASQQNRAAPSSRAQVGCAPDINIGSLKKNYWLTEKNCIVPDGEQQGDVPSCATCNKGIVGKDAEIVVDICEKNTVFLPL